MGRDDLERRFSVAPHLSEAEFATVKAMAELELPRMKAKGKELTELELERAQLLACFEGATNASEAFENGKRLLMTVTNKVLFETRVKITLLGAPAAGSAPEILTDEEWQAARGFYRDQLSRIMDMYDGEPPADALQLMLMTHAFTTAETFEDALLLGTLLQGNRPFDPVIFSVAVRSITGIGRQA